MHKNSIKLAQLDWRSIQNRVAYGLCSITRSVGLRRICAWRRLKPARKSRILRESTT
jgi:hypothetical protein